MPYLLIDDGMAENPKVVGLSDKAFRLWITALAYCARNLTDGAISEIALRFSGANSKIDRPKAIAKQLVSAGLWVVTDDGWQVHDYLEYNPSRAELQAKRELQRERQKRHRSKRNASQSRVTPRVSNAWQDPTKGVSKETPPAGNPYGPAGVTRDKALAAAHRLATTWTTPDSDTFALALDELQHQHGITLKALERETLWDTAHAASSNDETTAYYTSLEPTNDENDNKENTT